MNGKLLLTISGLAFTTLVMTSCLSDGVLDTVGAIGDAAGVPHAGGVTRGVKATTKALEDFDPAQRYYMGRTITATITSDSGTLANPAANRYINEIGQSLSLLSDKPHTWNGYRFIILDTDDINAFGAPGGFIMVSKGLLKCCKSEDEVAAVLAHEVAHVQLDHGISAIGKGRKVEVLKVLAMETAAAQGGNVGVLSDAFGGTIGDIVKNGYLKGYSRKFEGHTDLAALTILQRAGYDPYALARVLTEMSHRYTPEKKGFAKTHPDPKDRVTAINKALQGTAKAKAALPARSARYKQALGSI